MTNQFFDNVNWENLDILIIDLPPGTGDIQLTLAQKLALDGMLMVTTPQKIALEDVRKGSEMFKKVNVPILGVIENMSYLENGNEKLYPFGKGGGEELSKNLGVEFIGSLPLYDSVSKYSEDGKLLEYYAWTQPVFTDGR